MNKETPDKEYPKPCSICNKPMNNIHETHNASPIKQGRCCSTCNTIHVIEYRIMHQVLYGIPYDFKHPRLLRYHKGELIE